jgi:hypothetical protein
MRAWMIFHKQRDFFLTDDTQNNRIAGLSLAKTAFEVQNRLHHA